MLKARTATLLTATICAVGLPTTAHAADWKTYDPGVVPGASPVTLGDGTTFARLFDSGVIIADRLGGGTITQDKVSEVLTYGTVAAFGADHVASASGGFAYCTAIGPGAQDDQARVTTIASDGTDKRSQILAGTPCSVVSKVVGNRRGDVAVLVWSGSVPDGGGFQVWLRAAGKTSFRRILRTPAGKGDIRADIAIGPRGDLQSAFMVKSASGNRQLRSAYLTARGKLMPIERHGPIAQYGGPQVAVDETGARTLVWAAKTGPTNNRSTIAGASAGGTFRKRSTITADYTTLVTSPSGSAILEVLRKRALTIADVSGGRVGRFTATLPEPVRIEAITLGRNGAALAVYREGQKDLMIERPRAGKSFSGPHSLGLSRSTSYCQTAANPTGTIATLFCSSARYNRDDPRRALYVSTLPLGD